MRSRRKANSALLAPSMAPIALQLQRDLPQLALSAELQGINTSNPRILLAESLFEFRDTVQGVFATSVGIDRGGSAAGGHPAEPASGELAAAPRAARQARGMEKATIWAGVRLRRLSPPLPRLPPRSAVQVGRLDSRIAKDAPRTEFVKMTEARWKALAPAIDPHYYPIEVILHSSNSSLPSRRCAHHRFQSIRPANFRRRRSELSGARLSVCRESEKESRPANVPV